MVDLVRRAGNRQWRRGEATLTGPLRDQAALHGVLAKVRDLGLPLLAVSRLATGTSGGYGDGDARSEVGDNE